jgi:hypothetical protein
MPVLGTGYEMEDEGICLDVCIAASTPMISRKRGHQLGLRIL